jgi:hypothetical protein
MLLLPGRDAARVDATEPRKGGEVGVALRCSQESGLVVVNTLETTVLYASALRAEEQDIAARMWEWAAMEGGSLSLGDMLQALALVGAVIGLGLTVAQMRKTDKTERAKFFKELYAPFFMDPDFRRVFELIQGERFFNKEEQFNLNADIEKNVENEKNVEKVLSHFEMICSLYIRGLLSKEEMLHFDYNLKRLYRCESIRDYLDYIRLYEEAQRLEYGPFTQVRKYIKEVLNKPVGTRWWCG